MEGSSNADEEVPLARRFRSCFKNVLGEEASPLWISKSASMDNMASAASVQDLMTTRVCQ